MDQNEYRQLKESGGLTVVDAASLEEKPVVDEVEEKIEPEIIDDVEEEPEDDPVIEDEDDLPELNEKEKTAFEKRLERERTKLEEKIRAESEKKYGKHIAVVDLLGGDPNQVEQAILDNQVQRAAQRQAQDLAQQYNWTEEETQYYIQQQVKEQKKDQELAELKVQVQIHDLKDNPDYAGIGNMKKEIQSMISRSNNALSVEQAYWAMGGAKKAEQIRLEAQMRETERRKKTPRTVLTDSQTSTTSEKPLPPEIAQQAERMGISATEARRLMNSEPAKNIDDWRAKRKAK